MSQVAHIFTPNDRSLSERIRAYKKVVQALRNIEASMKLANQKEWSDRLGGQQELEEAHSIIQHSLEVAHQDIGEIEINKAREQGLLADIDLVERVRLKRQGKIKASRSQQSQSSSFQRKQ